MLYMLYSPSMTTENLTDALPWLAQHDFEALVQDNGAYGFSVDETRCGRTRPDGELCLASEHSHWVAAQS
jgi:hypothetical protein